MVWRCLNGSLRPFINMPWYSLARSGIYATLCIASRSSYFHAVKCDSHCIVHVQQLVVETFTSIDLQTSKRKAYQRCWRYVHGWDRSGRNCSSRASAPWSRSLCTNELTLVYRIILSSTNKTKERVLHSYRQMLYLSNQWQQKADTKIKLKSLWQEMERARSLKICACQNLTAVPNRSPLS